MQAFPTPEAVNTSTATPKRARRWRWVGHGTRAIAIAAAVTAAIGLTGTAKQPAVTLTAIDLGSGISVNPAPGWTIEDQGPGWVILNNAFATAELEVKVKPAKATDVVALLQQDINRLSGISTTGLTNVRNLSAPAPKPASGNFNQEAGIDYTADGTSRMGLTPVVGTFIELLNTSTHQSAFVVFAQNQDAPNRADGEGQAMIDSLL
jgi:hypothetical protein